VDVKGKVFTRPKDSLADIYVYVNDTSGNFLSYLLTRPEKEFKITVPQAGLYRLKIHAFGINGVDTTLHLDPGRYLRFTLTPKSERLDEVVLDISASEFLFKGDTIRYNVDAVRDSTEQTLRDLLKKLPGIQISGNIITVNGKRVDVLLINGKNLFDKYNKIALDNITSDAVEGVEYYDNYSDPMALGPQKYTSDITALNIKIKENFMYAVMGEVQLQAGYRNRFGVNNKTYFFGTSLMFYTVANMNNMGKEVFGLNDYIQLQAESGQTRLRIPPFLIDQNRVAYKKNKFMSLYMLYEPDPQKSRWKGYLLWNTDSANAFSSTLYYYYDPAIVPYEMNNTAYTKSIYLDGGIFGKYKPNERFRWDFQTKFFGNQLNNNLEIIYQILDTSASAEKSIHQNQPVENAWLDARSVLNWQTGAHSLLRVKTGWEYQKNLSLLEIETDSLIITPFFISEKFNQSTTHFSHRWEQAFVFETRLGRKTYLESDFSLQYFIARKQNLLDTTGIVFDDPLFFRNFTKSYRIKISRKFNRWRFRASLRYKFVSFFTDFAGRFDSGFWEPSFEVKYRTSYLIWNFKYEKTTDGAEEKYWFRYPVATAFNRFRLSSVTPSAWVPRHHFFQSVTNIKKLWGIHFLWTNYLTVSRRTPQSVTFFTTHTYLEQVFPSDDVSRNFISDLQLKRNFQKTGIRLSYSINYMFDQGYLYAVTGRFILKQSKISNYFVGSWKLKNFPLKISVRYLHDFIKIRNAQTLTSWNETNWQLRLYYLSKKWNAQWALIKYENRLNDSYRQPLVLNMELRYKTGLKSEIFFEVFNGLQLDGAEIRKIVHTPAGYMINNYSQLPGYITLGWRWEY